MVNSHIPVARSNSANHFFAYHAKKKIILQNGNKNFLSKTGKISLMSFIRAVLKQTFRLTDN